MLDFGTVMEVIKERLQPMAEKYWKKQFTFLNCSLFRYFIQMVSYVLRFSIGQVYVGIVSFTFDENNVLGSNPNDFGAICQRQIFHMIFLQFADKDNANERNEKKPLDFLDEV